MALWCWFALRRGGTFLGGAIKGGQVETFNDHRIAMSFAVAGGVSEGPVVVNWADHVATSFPNFVDLARSAGLSIKTSN